MSGAAVILKQNQLMRRFADAGATDPATAKVPEDIGCRQRWIFRRMVSRGVFVPVGDGQFYMDVGAADEFKRRRRKTALILVGLVLVLCLLWLIIVMGR
jgi:hypothetical protein